MLLISLRVGFAAAPMHAVLVGAVVPFAPRHDDACAFGQGSDLSRREGRIAWFRCCHSSSSVTRPTEGVGRALESLHTRSTRATKNSCLAPARTWTMIHFRPLGLVGNCTTITQAQRNRRSSLALLVSSRPSHGDSFVGAPASYLLRCRISHPLKASMGVLSATSRVRSADDFPLFPCLIGQTIADLEFHRQDSALISQRGGSAIGELFAGARGASLRP